ncbi:acyltransferase family protein [Pseudomonas protegens]|uniref:acyltransferase family protein n=1 Tax=Pseudomonas protegens TaxID=380021 RepID=UPI003FD8A4FC
MASSINNSFDPIRHLAALAVLVSHHFALSGVEEPAVNSSYSLGGLSVLAFFSISGYLITQSFLNSSSMRDFFQKRCARIFPALIVCSFLMVYAGQYFFGGQAATSLFNISNVLSFVKISFFGQATLPSVTSEFIFPVSFNGSLWSLKIEFACYILIGIGLAIYRGRLTPFLLAGAAIVSTLALLTLGHSEVAHKLSIYGSVVVAFFSGSALFFLRDSRFFGPRSCIALIASIVLLAVLWNSKYILAVGGIAFSYIFLWVGLSFGDKIIKRRFDISYGFYIYAFPVQQIVINKLKLGFVASLFISMFVTMAFAIVSWRFIEEPALRVISRRKRSHLASTLTGQHPNF